MEKKQEAADKSRSDARKESRKLTLLEKEEKSSAAFQTHIRQIDQNGKIVFLCSANNCDYVTVTRSKAVNHSVTHESKTKRKHKKLKEYSCQDCEFKILGKL